MEHSGETRGALICVDDEPIILLALKQELKLRLADKTIAVDTFIRAQEALTRIDDYVQRGVEVILIISDWLMPGMGGEEFLLKVHEKHPGIPVVLVTGQADENEIARLKEEVSLQAVIRKPWTASQLVTVVKSCIGH